MRRSFHVIRSHGFQSVTMKEVQSPIAVGTPLTKRHGKLRAVGKCLLARFHQLADRPLHVFRFDPGFCDALDGREKFLFHVLDIRIRRQVAHRDHHSGIVRLDHERANRRSDPWFDQLLVQSTRRLHAKNC